MIQLHGRYFQKTYDVIGKHSQFAKILSWIVFRVLNDRICYFSLHHEQVNTFCPNKELSHYLSCSGISVSVSKLPHSV